MLWLYIIKNGTVTRFYFITPQPTETERAKEILSDYHVQYVLLLFYVQKPEGGDCGGGGRNEVIINDKSRDRDRATNGPQQRHQQRHDEDH